MKPLFVSIHEGQREVHWTKLSVVAVAVLALTSILLVGVWYLLSQTLSLGALIVGLVLGVMVVVRMIARAVTYQEQELEAEPEPTVAS
jgi:hypothetical protein